MEEWYECICHPVQDCKLPLFSRVQELVSVAKLSMTGIAYRLFYLALRPAWLFVLLGSFFCLTLCSAHYTVLLMTSWVIFVHSQHRNQGIENWQYNFSSLKGREISTLSTTTCSTTYLYPSYLTWMSWNGSSVHVNIMLT